MVPVWCRCHRHCVLGLLVSLAGLLVICLCFVGIFGMVLIQLHCVGFQAYMYSRGVWSLFPFDCSHTPISLSWSLHHKGVCDGFWRR